MPKVVLAALLLWCSPAVAAPPEVATAWATLSQTRTLQADFELVQQRRILAGPVTSTGRLAFVRPDRMRWETLGDDPMVTIFAGSTVTVRLGDQPPQTLDLSGEPQLERIVRGLLVWLNGDLADVERDYEMAVHTSGAVELTPRQPVVAAILSRLTLTLSDDGRYVREVVLHEAGGDATTITLRSVRLDLPVDKGLFAAP